MLIRGSISSVSTLEEGQMRLSSEIAIQLLFGAKSNCMVETLYLLARHLVENSLGKESHGCNA